VVKLVFPLYRQPRVKLSKINFFGISEKVLKVSSVGLNEPDIIHSKGYSMITPNKITAR
jgi:hypothetical protein